MNGALALDDRALRVLLVFARVFLDHPRSFHNDALLFAHHADDLAPLAFVGTSDDDDFVVFLHVKCTHKVEFSSSWPPLQITSGASDTIFMNFLSRNSRATGPKIRVPRGFNSLSMMTMALLSNRKYEPSLRGMICRVRTTTASTTSPF